MRITYLNLDTINLKVFFMKNFITLLTIMCIATNVYAWKPIFVGHRGSYKGVANTAEAYRNGVDYYGYSGLECDVRVTKDREYVIMHDETTNSLGGSLNVASSTLAELKAETLKQTRGGVAYTGKICTVGEYLDICVEKNAFPLIELKWTTGINNNDMSNFPGLMSLVESKGLKSKAIFLTSMKNSIEYIRKNYPDVTCQFLTGQYWANHFDWCVEWNVGPSIQSGYFDIYTVKKFHEAGLKVAVWTVNDLANYEKYGNMGVSMMTGDYILPASMPELDEINWEDVPDKLDPIEVETSVLWERSLKNNNLPENFPNGNSETYKTAQQAAYYDGVFYTNDYGTSTLLAYDKDGAVQTELKGTNSHGIAVDDAGNLILRNDGITADPGKMIIYPKGSTTAKELTFSLPKSGQTNFISASGDVMSEEGGYVYMYSNKQQYVNFIKIANGEIAEITFSDQLSTPASTAGIVIPIGNDPTNFIYQVRSVGFYRFNGTNKGDYLTGGASTASPGRNSSVGGAFFMLGGHDILVHPSGTNYNGGISIKDMSAEKADLATFPPLGDAAYAGNPSTGCFIKAEEINESTYHIYVYCMGNGYAAYKINIKGSGIDQTCRDGEADPKLSVYPNPSSDIINIKCDNPINKIGIYNMNGSQVLSLGGNGNNSDQVDISALNNGIYFIRINDTQVTRIIKK